MSDSQRSPNALRDIAEVSAVLGIRMHTLHYWEKQFTQLKPVRRPSCRRYYRPEDIELLRRIKRLRYEQGYTVRGIRLLLDDDGVTKMAALKTETDGWEWAIVEIFGHRSHAGRTREEERFGAKMLRVDVPIRGDAIANGWETHWYGGSSIFSFTLTDEDSVMRSNKPYEPPARYRLPPPEEQSESDQLTGEEETTG